MTGSSRNPQLRDESDADGVAGMAIAGIKNRVRQPAWLGRMAGVGLCLSTLVFVGLVGVSFALGGQLVLVTEPLSLRIALVFPPLIALFTVGTIVGAIMGWVNGYWSRAVRIHQTFLALLGVGFVWQLVMFGFTLIPL